MSPLRMTSRNRRRDYWYAMGYFLALLFFIPIGIGKFVLGASWAALASVYAGWFLLLAAWGATSKGTVKEKTGWPIIFAMFFTIPVILIGVLVLREIGGIR